MNLDVNGLPVQSNGDANDQLQRCGMIVAALKLNEKHREYLILRDLLLKENCTKAIEETHQVRPGVYVRHIGGDPANVSADQLIGALAAHVALGNTKQVLLILGRILLKLGFAQNYKDGLDDRKQSKIKIPDFMLLRALSLCLRAHYSLYPLLLLADLSLVLLALSAIGPVWHDDKGLAKRGPDDVDDNNTILTLAVCSYKMPTPLSWLARKIYGRLRPINYGCREVIATKKPTQEMLDTLGVSPDLDVEVVHYPYHPVYGSLRWYHRAENGGNPEIAEMYKQICERYFE